MSAHELHEAVSAVCPISGVSVGDWSDKATWRIDYADHASDESKKSAQSVVAAFDPVFFERKRAKKTLDDLAERKRLKHITGGAGKALAYQELKEQANDVAIAVAANRTGIETLEFASLSDADQSKLTGLYPMIVAEIGWFGKTCDDVANVVFQQYAQFRNIEAELIKTVRAGKAAIDAAQSKSEVETVLASITWTV